MVLRNRCNRSSLYVNIPMVLNGGNVRGVIRLRLGTSRGTGFTTDTTTIRGAGTTLGRINTLWSRYQVFGLGVRCTSLAALFAETIKSYFFWCTWVVRGRGALRRYYNPSIYQDALNAERSIISTSLYCLSQ